MASIHKKIPLFLAGKQGTIILVTQFNINVGDYH